MNTGVGHVFLLVALDGIGTGILIDLGGCELASGDLVLEEEIQLSICASLGLRKPEKCPVYDRISSLYQVSHIYFCGRPCAGGRHERRLTRR